MEDLQDRIIYSDRYHDDEYEYRHVILPKELACKVPKDRLMSEAEWRALGVQQSLGWVHYWCVTLLVVVLLFVCVCVLFLFLLFFSSFFLSSNSIHKPEPHILLFRRPRTDI